MSALPTAGPLVTHLSAAALARLRQRLTDEVRASVEQEAAHDATARQLAGHTDADSAIERELALACAAHARETIGEVRDALDRLERGTYGLCQGCGAAIPLERLEVIPHARLCVECPDGYASGSGAGSLRAPRRRDLRLGKR